MRTDRRSILDTGVARVGVSRLPFPVLRGTCQGKAEIVPGGNRKAADDPRIVALIRKADYHGGLALDVEEAEQSSTAIPKRLEVIQVIGGCGTMELHFAT